MQSNINFTGFWEEEKKDRCMKSLKSMTIDVEVRRWLLGFFRPAFRGRHGGKKEKSSTPSQFSWHLNIAYK